MKNEFIDGVKIITLGLILGLGVGMVQATPWSYPAGTVPPTDTPPPISVGLTNQVKAPDPVDPTLFGIHNRRGSLSVGSLAVATGASFMKAVNIGLYTSGGDSLDVYGNKNIASALTVTSIKNSSVCTDTNGRLINCPLIPQNGVCGAANGTIVASIPTTNLCAVGTASPRTGTGPWHWTCSGVNGGTVSPTCTASSSAPSCKGTYLVYTGDCTGTIIAPSCAENGEDCGGIDQSVCGTSTCTHGCHWDAHNQSTVTSCGSFNQSQCTQLGCSLY